MSDRCVMVKSSKDDHHFHVFMASSSSRGQSIPYPSAARIADGQCYPQYTASLKCLEEFNKEKSKCQKHFDVYKECKKKEREARLERNRNRSLFS